MTLTSNRQALSRWLAVQTANEPEALTKLIERCHNVDFLTFNKIIGLPRKNGVEHQIYDYEHHIEKLLLKDNIKYLMIKKSVGLGITECVLRIILFCCMRNNTWKGRQVIILVGPSISLAIKLIKRLKMLLEPFEIYFTPKETVLNINSVEIECFPSHQLDSFRSLTAPAFIYVSEADFFPFSQQQDVRLISERYIPKSDPIILLESTPNAPGGLFDSIEREKNSMYTKLVYDCYVGLNKIYTQTEINNAKLSAAFAREMSPLQYLGGSGNVFSDFVITQCSNTEYSLNPTDYQFSIKCGGLDWGQGSSKTALVILAFSPHDNKIKVVHAQQWTRPDYDKIFPLIWEILKSWEVPHLVCDGSSPSNVTYFMRCYGDPVGPINYMEQIKKYKTIYKYSENYWEKLYHCLPISWAVEGRKLLSSFKLLTDNQLVSVHRTMIDVQIALRSATMENNWDLDKSLSSNNDILDAMIAAARPFSYKKRTT